MTELIITAATLVQRAEIEKELLKIRLKQRCFIALAAGSPKSVVQRPMSEEGAAVTDAPLQTLTAEEHNRFPKGRW